MYHSMSPVHEPCAQIASRWGPGRTKTRNALSRGGGVRYRGRPSAPPTHKHASAPSTRTTAWSSTCVGLARGGAAASEAAAAQQASSATASISNSTRSRPNVMPSPMHWGGRRVGWEFGGRGRQAPHLEHRFLEHPVHEERDNRLLVPAGALDVADAAPLRRREVGPHELEEIVRSLVPWWRGGRRTAPPPRSPAAARTSRQTGGHDVHAHGPVGAAAAHHPAAVVRHVEVQARPPRRLRAAGGAPNGRLARGVAHTVPSYRREHHGAALVGAPHAQRAAVARDL